MRAWSVLGRRKPAEFEGPEYEPISEPCPGCGGIGGVHEEQCPFKPPEALPSKETEAIQWEDPVERPWSPADAFRAWEGFTEEDRRMVLSMAGAPHRVGGMELGEVRNLEVVVRYLVSEKGQLNWGGRLVRHIRAYVAGA